MADFHRFSAGAMAHSSGGANAVDTYRKDAWVEVYVVRPQPRRWVYAKINKVDGAQVQCTYLIEEKLYQYWFHVDSGEIAPLRHNQSNASAAASANANANAAALPTPSAPSSSSSSSSSAAMG